MSKLYTKKFLLPLAIFGLLLAGCSSGGGNNGDSVDQDRPTPNSSNWDKMTWDKDNWS